MRLLTVVVAAWICLYRASSFAADAPNGDRGAGTGAQDNDSIFLESPGSGERIDPSMVSRRLSNVPGDQVDTPTEEFVTFTSILWIHFTSDQMFEFEQLDPTDAELGVVRHWLAAQQA